MEFSFKNIGNIKESEIKNNSITIIAGKNDSGKTTIGKILFALLKTNLYINKYNKNEFEYFLKKIFEKMHIKQLLNENSYFEIKYNNKILLEVNLKNNKFFINNNNKRFTPIFIDTPLIFNLYETFKSIKDANNYLIDFKIPYNYLWWDLFLKLSHKSKYYNYNYNSNKDLIEKIEKTINGYFKKIEKIGKDKWVFVKNGKELDIENISMGIKQFGILYALLKNGYIGKNSILIINEPENHLFLEWQIKYAEILVELAKRKTQILVNSYSPFFIEAIENLSNINKIKVNYYLSNKYNENSFIVEKCNVHKIYDLSADCIDKLEQMEVNSLNW